MTKIQSTPLTEALVSELHMTKIGGFIQAIVDSERLGLARELALADTDGTDYTVLFYEGLGEAPRLQEWGPRALVLHNGKMKCHYLYSSLNHRDDKVHELLRLRARELEAKLESKVAKKALSATAAPPTPNGCKIGDIYVCSWGYDQTNVDFYEIVATPTAKTIHLRRLCATSQGADNEKVAIPGKYLNDEILTKRVSSSDSFSLSKYKWLHRWDGTPQYETPANMGH